MAPGSQRNQSLAMPCAILALLAAAFLGLTVHTRTRWLGDTDRQTGSFIAVATMTLMLWLLAPSFARRGGLAYGAAMFRRETLGWRHPVVALPVVAGGAMILSR